MNTKLKIIGIIVCQLFATMRAFSTCTEPGSFTLNTPSQGIITSSSVSITWTTSAFADYYKVFHRVVGEAWPSNGMQTSTKSMSITGLQAGTEYEVRVLALNICEDDGGGGGGGEDPPVHPNFVESRSFETMDVGRYSNEIEFITETAKPRTRSADNRTAFTFDARWHSEASATSYRLDVSTENDFSSFVSGYHNLNVGSATSRTVSGLQSATKYYYRIRAVNGGGTSVSSDGQYAYTIPEAPDALDADEITQTSFSANWTTVPRANSYRIDVSENANFGVFSHDFLPNYQNRIVSGGSTSSVLVSIPGGLEKGQTYYYRIRAYDTFGDLISENSNTVSVTTIPPSPGIAPPSHMSQSSFRANWNSAAGASNYRLDVSTSDAFGPGEFVEGYENVNVGGTTNFQVEGLVAGATYYYRLRSGNGSGLSENSQVSAVLLKPANPVASLATNFDLGQFTAVWQENDIVADGYLIQIARNVEFSPVLPGYDGLIENTSVDVTDLDDGTVYYYRLKAVNEIGESDFSNVIETVTIPGRPTTLAPSDFTAGSFVANWSEEAGASAYFLDVSETEDFSSLLPDYTDFLLSGTSQSVTGLEAGTKYYYRVRASNSSGASLSSSGREALTVAPPPAIRVASNTSTDGFMANWEGDISAQSFLFDLAVDPDFENPVDGYLNRVVDEASSLNIGSLTPGIVYYYRVRSVNSSGISSYSETQEVLTAPSKAAILSFSEQSSDKFKVEWATQNGVAEYEIYVAEDVDFEKITEDNNPRTVSSVLTETFVDGLLPNTLYFVKIRAVNSGGYSEFSEIKITSTTSSDGTVLSPSIDDLRYDESTQTISWGISGGVGGITSVKFLHKKITDTEFAEEEISINESGEYSIVTQDDWMDLLGMQYQVIVEDLTARMDRSQLALINRMIPNVHIETDGLYGTGLESYQMISVPYELANTRIQDLFEGVLGSYDKSKWRLLKYIDEETGYLDYEDGLSVSQIERGAGYWFVSAESIDLNFGEGTAPSNTLDEPFQLTLKAGWNQIGNPYLEEISWQDVLSLNGNPEVVGPLFTYDSKNIALIESDTLKLFGGGFVFADAAITLEIPININQSNARLGVSRTRIIGSGAKDWELPITISQGGMTSQVTGVGMHQDAAIGKDQFDIVRLPSIGNGVHMNTIHTDFFYQHFARDVVPTLDHFAWNFEVSNGAGTQMRLSWKPESVPSGTLVLYNVDEDVLIDMSAQYSYEVEGSPNLRIYYSEGEVSLRNATLGAIYPNPMRDQVQMTYGFHIGEEASNVHLSVFDLSGNLVVQVQEANTDQGIRAIIWDGRTNSGDRLQKGLYFYNLKSSLLGQTRRISGKLIIE
jgi:phosphodiesterase/alkaline phosphatase D-like protein